MEEIDSLVVLINLDVEIPPKLHEFCLFSSSSSFSSIISVVLYRAGYGGGGGKTSERKDLGSPSFVI